MSESNNWGVGTKCIQEGYRPGIGEARVLPIIQSTTYKYEDIDQVARLFSLQESGNKYGRTGNPTANAFEAKVAALEGGVGALSTASGQSAIFLAISNIVQAGDHVVASNAVYGGTYTLLSVRLKKLGVETTFVNPEDPIDELRKVFKPNTKVIIGETIGNPALGILDFDKFATLAKEFDVPFIVDNTLATPFICKPLKHGANVVINSATKYMDGHAVALGGVIVDGGSYNWANGKFPDFTEPDEQYANTSYTGKFGKKAYITKARAQYIRDFGPTIAPIHAFLINLGLETLHLRMPRHSENAYKLAKFLKSNKRVNWVNYPGLEDNVNYPRISKYFDYHGASGVLTFGLKGGNEAIKKFAAALKVAALVVHVGDARTSILHPATSTHSQMSPEQRHEAGIPDDMIRVSVGIEDSEDIIADFDQAIQKAFEGVEEIEKEE
ncbi:O-acetylhomoserine/O-acetylserine sulfhydrylase, partial [Neocallimastix californiae]